MTKQEIRRILLRMPKKLHDAFVKLAKEKKISLNQLFNEVMAGYTGESLDTDIIDEFRQRIEALENDVKKLKEKEKK